MSIVEMFKAVVQALEANTKAVMALESSLAGRTPSKAVEKAKPESKKEEVKLAAVEALVAEQVEEHEAIGESTSVSYEEVRSLVLKLASAGKRDEIKSLNVKHGIANLKVLLDKEDDFSTVNDQLKLEAVYEDLQALEG